MFYFTLCRGEEEGPENRRDLLQPEKGLIILSRPNLEGQCSRGRTSLPHSMGIVGLKQVKWLCETTGPAVAHLLDDLAPAVDGAVVDHVHDGHAQVAADAEADAEAQAAHDGDDIATWQTEAPAVAQRRLLLRHLQGLPILRQLDGLPGLLLLLQHPARHTVGRQGRHGLGTPMPAHYQFPGPVRTRGMGPDLLPLPQGLGCWGATRLQDLPGSPAFFQAPSPRQHLFNFNIFCPMATSAHSLGIHPTAP